MTGFLKDKLRRLSHEEAEEEFRIREARRAAVTGEDPEQQPLTANRNGFTPLHLAALHSENPEIIQALLDGGADVNSKDEDDQTPLHWAAQYSEHPEIIQALLDGGAYVNATDTSGRTPLDLARANKNWGAAQVLEEASR